MEQSVSGLTDAQWEEVNDDDLQFMFRVQVCHAFLQTVGIKVGVPLTSL